MTPRQEARLNELNTAYNNEVRSILESGNEPVASMIRAEATLYDGTNEAGSINMPIVDSRPASNKANYQPEINQVNNGFIVRLGCQSFVFETFDKMYKYLKMYFEDPNGTETKFHKNELF
jgi:hypothetical protein